MDKLVERESAASRGRLSGAPALAVQFFLIPLIVVGVTAGIYIGFRALLADNRSAKDYLTEIRTGGENRRWPAAYELSRLMADPKVRASDATLVPGLLAAFEQSLQRTSDGTLAGDPMVRRYLALAIGRLDTPAPKGAVALLLKAVEEPSDGETRINAIWALGSLREASAVPTLEALFDSADTGIRKMAVYALGAIPQARESTVLVTALNDAAADVQWNAAVALARHGRREGLPVIQRMLDRVYLASAVKVEAGASEDDDPAGDVMITGLQAAAALRDPSLRAAVEQISQADKNMRVRQAALEALKTL